MFRARDHRGLDGDRQAEDDRRRTPGRGPRRASAMGWPQGRSAVEDVAGETFLFREEWALAQGKKVDPPALRLRRSRRSRSSARSGHQEARCVRALNRILRRKRGGMTVVPHKMSDGSGVEKETVTQEETGLLVAE